MKKGACAAAQDLFFNIISKIFSFVKRVPSNIHFGKPYTGAAGSNIHIKSAYRSGVGKTAQLRSAARRSMRSSHIHTKQSLVCFSGFVQTTQFSGFRFVKSVGLTFIKFCGTGRAKSCRTYVRYTPALV